MLDQCNIYDFPQNLGSDIKLRDHSYFKAFTGFEIAVLIV